MRSIILIILISAGTVSAQIRTDFDRKMAAPAEPFRIIGNIYYVGAADAASYLISTNKGHILLDGAFAENAPQIESNIEKLGFKLTDVKILLNNHAHTDHAGGLALLKKKSGAKLYAPKKQAVQLKRGGKDDFAFGNEMTFSPVIPDKRIRNNDRIRLGGTELVAHFTPGHTKGCTSFTTTVEQDGQFYQVIFVGSLSALDYDLVSNNKYKSIAKDFKSTFDLLRSMKVDVFLGSHASFFKMSKKLAMLKTEPETNPFVDPQGFRDFVTRNEKSFLEKLDAQLKLQNEKAK